MEEGEGTCPLAKLLVHKHYTYVSLLKSTVILMHGFTTIHKLLLHTIWSESH